MFKKFQIIFPESDIAFENSKGTPADIQTEYQKKTGYISIYISHALFSILKCIPLTGLSLQLYNFIKIYNFIKSWDAEIAFNLFLLRLRARSTASRSRSNLFTRRVNCALPKMLEGPIFFNIKNRDLP